MRNPQNSGIVNSKRKKSAWVLTVCALVMAFVLCGGILIQDGLAQHAAIGFAYDDWKEFKSRHFIVYIPPGGDVAKAGEILRLAEDYYRTVGDLIGFTRYTDYWTWDKRARIFIFPDARSFAAGTGAPAWSTGYAARDRQMLQFRAIVTYEQEEGLFDNLLPHEIAHLVLHDFVLSENLPVWVDEGIAQLYEKDKHILADRMMNVLVGRGHYVPLDILNSWDIRQERDSKKVEVFYAQSLSLMRFLRDRYGRDGFRRFCRNLRDGKTADEALRSAYPMAIRSLKELEQLWLAHIKSAF